MYNIYSFQGATVTYEGQEIALSEHVLLLDGTLENNAVAEHPYVFNDIRALVDTINAFGKKSKDLITVYIAPHVYWIDNPDATDTVQVQEGYALPFGLVVECDALKLVGLSEDANHTILAGNRGQSHGANGNYTMFCFKVRDLELQNLTIGNYCSVDLEYSLKPELSRKKRTNSFTQAQLAWQQGDKLWARKCRFVSRLNLMPVCGGERCLYENCHFESTDDALNGRGVYLDCDFDFYGNRPFYSTRDAGAVFLNCIFRSRIKSAGLEKMQYFTKEGGPVTVVDCEFQRVCRESGKAESMEKEISMEKEMSMEIRSASDGEIGFGWTKYPEPSLRCYQSRVSYQGKPVIIGGEGAAETIPMEGKDIEGAYRLEADGKVIYNTYNLLRGGDDWDPMQVKDAVIKAGKEAVPTLLTIKASGKELISGEESITLEADVFYFYGKQMQDTRISFGVSAEDKNYVRLTDNGNGTCLVEGINEENAARNVIVYASTTLGLEAAVQLRVIPGFLEAPGFITEPKVEIESGVARAVYEADFGGFEEQSEVSWYRCKSATGGEAVCVAVSGENMPMKEYTLTAADEGYYLMVQVKLRHSRSSRGAGVYAVSARMIEKGDIAVLTQGKGDDTYRVFTDFWNMPTQAQEKILPGFWTMDKYRPKDTAHFGKWESAQSLEPWKYGETGNGSVGKGLYQNVQGARLMYTPLAGQYGDMTLRVRLDPAKTAGQGFGSAGQYLDLCVKFDTATLTGYGVRILRSAEASDAVRFLFVEYSHGRTKLLNEGLLTSCFLTGCEIVLTVKGNHMMVHAESEAAKVFAASKPYELTVDMDVEIEGNEFGGVAIQHTGTPGTGGWQNTTMLHSLELQIF